MSAPSSSVLRDLVEAACTAPSVHNTQPWRWVARGAELRLFADTRRQLVYADAARRDLIMSCGAALHQLEVAARMHGWQPHVTRLPDAADGEHLATVSFTPYATTLEDLQLGQAMARRRTDRRQVSSWAVPEGHLQFLARQASRLGVLATVIPAGRHDAVLDLLAVATQLQNTNDAYLDELIGWTHTRVAAGIPTSNLLTREAAQAGVTTRFPAGTLADDYVEDAEPQPSWLVLSTTSDDTLSWLRAGEALEALWLSCTSDGLAVVPFTQPIEVDSCRASVTSNFLDGTSCPQLLLRVGWPPVSREPVTPTPRHPVELVLTFES